MKSFLIIASFSLVLSLWLIPEADREPVLVDVVDLTALTVVYLTLTTIFLQLKENGGQLKKLIKLQKEQAEDEDVVSQIPPVRDLYAEKD